MLLHCYFSFSCLCENGSFNSSEQRQRKTKIKGLRYGRSGKPAGKIAGDERFAADKLVEHLELISGAKLPIATVGDELGGPSHDKDFTRFSLKPVFPEVFLFITTRGSSFVTVQENCRRPLEPLSIELIACQGC